MCQKRGFDPKNSTGLSPSWCKGDRGQVWRVGLSVAADPVQLGQEMWERPLLLLFMVRAVLAVHVARPMGFE